LPVGCRNYEPVTLVSSEIASNESKDLVIAQRGATCSYISSNAGIDPTFFADWQQASLPD
jgi:hypothetical protein